MADNKIVEQLTSMGTGALKEITEWTKTAKDFAVEQVPLIIKEILTWRLSECIFALSLCALIILICAIVSYCIVKNYRKWQETNKHYNFSDYPQYVVPMTFSAIVGVISFVVMCIWIYSLLFVIYAPRLYVLEYLSKLVK